MINIERIIQRVEFASVPTPKPKRVAAYARVSLGNDEMLHSLAAQVSYYNKWIHTHPGWVFAGVYADEAISGAKANRKEFNQMLTDCRNGKIDMIVTKSVSRFARNTIVLLETVRELKSIGVNVFFEEQNIDTGSSEGEFMLTLLASFAQEELVSVSENQKWKIRKMFEAGIPNNCSAFGYKYGNHKYEIVSDEAETVICIFSSFLAGNGPPTIAKELNDRGVPTRFHGIWRANTVRGILSNEAYVGKLTLQKTFRVSPITGERAL